MAHNTDTKNNSDFVIPDGLRIDLDEGWKKIISRQFGGNPGRGFGELIQNFLDSYDASVPWDKRRGEITFGDDWVSLKDYGSGISLSKFKLVTSMGGTDKHTDPTKIGKFGIGFFSIFNPKLGTRKVEIITKCEGQAVKLEYIVIKDGQRPNLDYEVLDHEIDFSTEVKVYFDRPGSAKQCIDYGKSSLKYYPCDIQINGARFQSVWEDAAYSNAFVFAKKNCNGFFKTGNRFRSTTILCKYEYISEMPLRYFITGGHNVRHNLDDFHSTETPFMPGLEMVLNCNQLSVTISRDNFYLDYNYKNMISDMNESLLELMNRRFDDLTDEVKLANLYILRNRIKSYWNRLDEKLDKPSPSESVFYKLLNSKLFRVNGKKKPYSALELMKMKSKGIPLFFSEKKTNLRWLGGAFKHDYIVLPDECLLDKGAPDFNNALFNSLFDDVINLDTISDDRNMINELIEREIIRKESMEPDCNFIETRVLTKKEKLMLEKFESLLNRADILETIEQNLNIPVRNIHPSFFILKNGGMHISTGLFDEHRNPINDDFISNFIIRKEEASAEERLNMKNTILLGLCLNHPFIRRLIASEDPHKEYFALTYIAHELTSCQKLLSPYSSFFQLVKSRLSSELQKNMLAELVKEE